MNKTLIIGASGKIGKITTKKLLKDNQEVVALVRDKSKLSDVSGATLKIVEADLEQDFSHAFSGCDTVIFTAGSGGNTGADKTVMIDLWAACQAVDYAKKAGVSHFIMVSSIGADDPEQGTDDMKPYLVAKHLADEHLKRSGLNYTIFRPGSLTDGDAKGEFATEQPPSKEDRVIRREDVASALAFAVTSEQLNQKILTLFNGSKTLKQALGVA